MRTLKKLAQLFHEKLPAQQRIYFIYTHKNGFDRFYNGLKANTEISYHGYSALRGAFPRVRFLRLEKEHLSRIEEIRPQDVVIGHMGETFLRASGRTKRLITFGPWAGHEDRSERNAFNCVPKEIEMGFFERAASIILLTSEYNKKEYLEKPRNFWYAYFQKLQGTKSIRVVHQPIDLSLFKRIKHDYTTNNFLYIGNDAHMKGLDSAKELVKRVGRTLHLYGVEGKKIDHRREEEVRGLPLEADFFIQPGMWEAQCVSILESAARGFIPIVTPETGYPYTHPFLLRFDDFEYNSKRLQELLHLPPSERKELADGLHHQLTEDVHHNNWKRLTDVLVEEVLKIKSA
jgi:hypothetical protein